MFASRSETDSYNEGYPRSSDADLDPGPDVRETLDHADRVASNEHRVVDERRRVDDPTNSEDQFEDVDDIDDAAIRV